MTREDAVETRDLLLQKYLDGEASEGEMAEIEALMGSDASFGEEAEASREIGVMLREGMMAQAEEVDFDALWSRVGSEIDWYDAGQRRIAAARAEQAGVSEEDTSWVDSFRQLLGWRFVSGVAALALLVVIAPRLVDQTGTEGPPIVGETQVIASAEPLTFDVEVESVQAADSATVMVFQGGEGAATFIWVSEMDSSEEQAI